MSLKTPIRALILLPLGLVLPAASAISAPALDLSAGSMRLSLYEDIGRFSLAYAGGRQAANPVPLLAAQDPRTTTLSVLLDTRIYRMGESPEFSSSLQKTQLGARFLWVSPLLSVTEDFSFLSSQGSTDADGVRIDITLKNLSRQDFKAGVRYLFDTYLGEPGPVHFSTDRQPVLKRETTLAGQNLPAWWLSPRAGDPDQLGLQCMVSGQGITKPDRIVFANWKRLSDASWSYETSASRDFSLQPYSVNDSAVSQYYDPRTLAPGAQVTMTIVLGKYNPAGFTLAPARAAPSDFAASIQKSLDAGKTAPSASAALRADLSALNTILARVDAGLAAGGSATDDELALMESAIADLKARRATYGSQK